MKLYHKIPHLTTGCIVAFVAIGAIVAWITQFNLAAVIPISVFFAAIPLAISQSMQTILQGIAAGQTLRREGELREGLTISYQNREGAVDDLRLRTAILHTDRGYFVTPYNQLLLNGFEVITKESK